MKSKPNCLLLNNLRTLFTFISKYISKDYEVQRELQGGCGGGSTCSALGKSELAIADEFDMKFVPGFTMDDYYVNHYGYDLRELDYRFAHERNVSYDEKKFSKDPLGQDGGLDRMLWCLHMFRYMQYVDVLEHIFNTGEGVVIERSPFSDWAYIDAAYNQGWIDKTTKTHYWKVRERTFFIISGIIQFLPR